MPANGRGRPRRGVGGLARELVRSELFGHERGAFTGAVERHPGLLTMAHGGTVFLDEFGDLAPGAQVMLLRFLAEVEVRPVGSTRATRADVRVIAATHRDLTRYMREERFREDLFYRLRRVVLTVPPLRERPEDVPLLVEHFRREVNARHRLSIEGLTPGALRRLTAYRWPGNVRELEAVLEEAMILKGQGWLPGSGAPRARRRNVGLNRFTRRCRNHSAARQPPAGRLGARSR